jgi:sodium transport system permease protein
MRMSVIGLVYRKEIRETLRDRRTLFIMIVLPILLYPVLMLGLTSVAAERVQRLTDRTHVVAVEGACAGLVASLVKNESFEVIHAVDAARAVRDKDAVAGLRLEPGFEDALERGEARVEVIFSNAEERSLVARRALRDALEEFREKMLAERLGDAALLHPFKRTETDVSGVSGSAMFASRVLGLLVVLMMLTAAFYPAIDLGAGEKERGTLETLLVAPVGRAEIVMGKYLTILTVALAAAMLNLVAMGLTVSQLGSSLSGAGGQSFDLGFGPIAAMLLLLVPLGALFSAASLALSAFARSYKEGMHYLTPLAVVVMPLALVSSLPDVRLDIGLALLPVTGSVLVFRDLLIGKGDLVYGLLAFGSSAAVAGLALTWCVSLFKREDVLFRPADGGGLKALRAEAMRRGVPTGGEATLLFVLALALQWLVATRFMATGIIRGHVLTQILLIAGPAVVYSLAMGYRIRETFRLRVGRPRVLVAAGLLGPALAVLLLELYHRLGLDSGEDARNFARALEAFMGLPLGLRLLLLALLPAICEEVLFRGFVLTGLRHRFGPVRAVILCGILFGVLHLSPARIPVTAALGIVLAILALRGDSLLPAVLCHALYNGLIIGGDDLLPSAWIVQTGGGGFAPLVIVAAGLLAIAGAWLLLADDPPEAVPEP